MKKKLNLLAAFAFIAVLLIVPQLLFAEITFENAWIRATPPKAKMSAAYMIIKNTSSNEDQLLSVTSDISEATEIHTVLKENGMMKMRPVSSIDIPANGERRLKKGGFHIMLIRLKHILKPGDQYPLVLTFKKAGQITLNIFVRKK